MRSVNFLRSLTLVAILAVAMTCCRPRGTREFLYIESPEGALSTYKIEPDGALTLTATLAGVAQPSQFEGPPVISITVQPGGRFASATVPYQGSRCYTVDSNDGRLVPNPGACAPPATAWGGMTMSPRGRFLYDDGADLYEIDRVTGRVTEKVTKVQSALDLGTDWKLALAQSGKFAYVLHQGTNNISSYRIDADGSMRLISGLEGVPTGDSPSDMVVDPGGYFAYALNAGDDTISEYFIDPRNGELRINSQAPTIRTGSRPTSAVIDGSGRFLYCTNSIDESINQYRIESDGSLSFAGRITAAGIGEESMMTDPAGKFIYLQVGTEEKAGIIGFRIASDGHLIRIKLAPIPVIGADWPFFLPASAWLGSRPDVQIVKRDVTPLMRMKTPIAGTFSETGRLTPAMYVTRSVGGTVLPDGRVFLPEEDEDGLPNLHADIYDPRSGRFTSSGIIAKGAYAVARLLDGRFLIGFWPPNKLSILDPATMKMTPAGHFKANCHDRFSIWLLKDGRILFPAITESPYVEGQGDRSCAGEIYDPSTGQSVDTPKALSSLDNLSYSSGIVAVLSDGRLLVVRNNIVKGRQPIQVYIYDLAADRMTSLGDFPSIMTSTPPIVLKDGRVLFVSVNPGVYGNSGELFDPRTSKFISLGPLAQTHGDGFNLTLLADGKVLISGGVSGEQGGRSNAELFDPRTRKFTPTGTMTTVRTGPVIVVLDDGTVLFAGGDRRAYASWGTRSSWDTAEIYHPPTNEVLDGSSR
jgi:Lactonase, 7-bladed beta-propeller